MLLRTGNRPFAIVDVDVREPDNVMRLIEAVEKRPEESYLCVIPRWLAIVNEDAVREDYDDLFWRSMLGARRTRT